MKSDVKIGDDSLEMSRFFGYPRELVFAAWTDAEQLGAWWGCDDSESVRAEIDLKVGGVARYVMQMKDGSEIITEGVYTEIVAPERLVTRSEMGAGTPYEFKSTSTVEFQEEDGGTLVKLTIVGLPPMPGACDIVSSGFNASFDKLERFLAR